MLHHHVLELLVIGIFVWLAGCSFAPQDSMSEKTWSDNRLAGVWTGISVNNCSPVQVDPSRCRAVDGISFTMLHGGNYDFVDNGVIRQMKLNGRSLSFRVMRNDGSSCIFNTVPELDTMTGGFICLQGAAPVERGIWQVMRAY
jgi:hypothetical protein